MHKDDNGPQTVAVLRGNPALAPTAHATHAAAKRAAKNKVASLFFFFFSFYAPKNKTASLF